MLSYVDTFPAQAQILVYRHKYTCALNTKATEQLQRPFLKTGLETDELMRLKWDDFFGHY